MKLRIIFIALLGGLLFAARATASEEVATEVAKPAKPAKGNVGELRKIKLRMQRTFATGKPGDPEVASLLASFEPDGSFGDIDYDDEAFNTGGHKTQHLTRLTKLAKAYAVTPGTYYKSREVYDAVAQGLRYWVKLNAVDKNWWHRIIGFPKNLMVPLVLLADDMKRYDKDLYQQCLEYELYSWSIPKQRAQDGANGTDICKFTFAAAVLSEDEALLREVMDKVNSLIKIASGDREEGIQPDFSYTQHNGSGRQLYLATYGREYVDGILYFMDFVADTDFWLAPEKVDIFERLFLEGLSWTWYGGEIDVNQYGRGLLRASTAPSFLVLAQRLASFNTPRVEELKRLLSFMKGSQEMNGNRYFPRADYMIHRPAGAMISTRMTSTRTVGNEAGNSEGMLNYHTGDGAVYIKVHGDEYTPVFHGWNWRRIPGTTIVADTKEMPAPMWGAQGGGGNDFAGGASDGRNGVCAFIYDKDQTRAHKAWFYFDSYFVALGAGIATERSDAPVVTTVNQTRLAGKVQVAAADNIGEWTAVREAEGVERVWHYDTGYRFDEGSPALFRDKGEWGAKYTGKKCDILRMEVSHGVAPKEGRYAWAVYPAMDCDTFMKRGDDYTILSNTEALQAVQDRATKKTMAVCYEAATFEAEGVGRVTVDAPCLVIVSPTEGGLQIEIASPYIESRPLERVTVTVGTQTAVVALENYRGTTRIE